MPTRPFLGVAAKTVLRSVALSSLFCGLATAASAQDRDVVLRFLPPEDSEISGYLVYVTDLETEIEALLDAGFVPPDPDGVAQTTVVLDATRAYRVDMTAHNEAGESGRSNEILIAAETPVCDAALCDDGNACTSDHCGPSECINTPEPDGSLCDDGYVDTVDDQCNQGVCEGLLLACREDLDCDDGNVCNGHEVCEGGAACLEGITLDCGPPTACTVTQCDPVAGCLVDSEPDGTPCDDGRADTQNDSCQAGICQGVPEDPGAGLAIVGLTPDTVSPGRQTIQIDGEGFELGAVLTFQNGAGRTPKVKSMRLLDSRTLEASIDVSRKGPRRARLFDARVTLPDGRETLLPDALRINP